MGIDIYTSILYGVILPVVDDDGFGVDLIDPETEELTWEFAESGATLHQLGYYESDRYLLGFEIMTTSGSQVKELDPNVFLINPTWEASIQERLGELGLYKLTSGFYLSPYLSY